MTKPVPVPRRIKKSLKGARCDGCFARQRHPTMNTLPKLPLVLAVVSLLTTSLSAQFETFKIQITVEPQLSPVMHMQGVTEGKLVLALDISAEGRITDWLVLGTTHPALVTPCVDALKRWEITPAKLNGEPVPVQTELTINYRAEGVVISRPAVLDVAQHLGQRFGYKLVPNGRSLRELESRPTPITTVAPEYAIEAEKDGVRGAVRIHFYIDETGAVRMPSVSGDAHPYLAQQAVQALRTWRFEPAKADGQPVMVAALQEFNFSR